MRRWLVLATRLYPARWRSRYGEEFQALLEDVRPGWRELADILRGALIMQIANGTAFLRVAAALAAAGALISAGISFTARQQFVSSAIVRSNLPQNPDEYSRNQFEQMREEILSRSQLAALIQRPSLALYESERRRYPIEDIVRQMRAHIRIQQVGADAYRISFSHPDRRKAGEVARQLTAKFSELSAVMNRQRDRVWRKVFPGTETPAGPSVTVMEEAGPPERPAAPNRLPLVSLGALGGLALAAALWRPGWTLRLAACGAAGCLVAFELSFLFPLSFTSIATLRFTAAMVPERSAGVIVPEVAERFRTLEQEVTSVVESKVRQNIQIQPPGVEPVFRVSFTNADRFTAKRINDQLVAAFLEQNTADLKARVKMSGNAMLENIYEAWGGANLDVLEPSSIPEAPDGPDRLSFAGAGLLAGLLLGTVRLPRGPAAALLTPVQAT